MIELVVILYTFIVTLVTSNPLQGFQSCPVIQYQQNYRNVQQPIVIQPSDYKFYPQQYSVQNQLTQQNNPFLNEDYSKRSYLNNNLSSQRVPLIIEPNGIEYQWYGSSPIINVPYGTKEYAVLPAGYSSENDTVLNQHNNTNGIKKKQSHIKNNYDGIKTKKKSKKAHKKYEKIKGGDSFDSKVVKQDNSDKLNHQSNKETKKSSKTSRAKNKTQKSNKNNELKIIDQDDNFLSNHIDTPSNEGKNNKRKKKTRHVKNDNLHTKDNNNDETNEKEVPMAKKRSKQVKSKSNNQDDKNYNKDNSLIIENENCFDINKNCAELENRKTRNYYNNANKHSKPPFYMPFDYSVNNIASYINSLISNPQFNTQMWNANDFYYNLDYLYQLPQFQLLMTPQDNINKRTSKRKKKKKSSQDSTNTSNKRSKENNSESCNKINVNPQELLKDDVNNKSITSTVVIEDRLKVIETANQNEKFEEFQSSQTIFDLNGDIVEPHLDNKINNKNVHEQRNEDNAPFINGLDDEYYPDFTADSMYNSKENQYWEAFHERHYYFSDDKNKTKNKNDFVSINDAHIEDYFDDNQEPVQKGKDEINESETLQNKKNPTISAKQINFMTPPGLEYPDFETHKINKEINDLRPDVPYYPSNKNGKEDNNLEESNEDTENRYSPILEMYYEPSNKISKKYQNKMSTYSSAKKPLPSANSNDIIDQNNVETIFVESKVIKYSPMPEEVITESSSASIEDQRESKNLISYDGNTYVVLAKSITDDIY